MLLSPRTTAKTPYLRRLGFSRARLVRGRKEVGHGLKWEKNAGFGSQSSAEFGEFCMRVLQQAFYYVNLTQNLPAETLEPQGSAEFWGGGVGARTRLLRTAFFSCQKLRLKAEITKHAPKVAAILSP